MRSFLMTSMLLLSSAVMADANTAVQQMPLPVAMDSPMQLAPQQTESSAQQAAPVPAITPEMQRLLMRMAQQQAEQEAAQAAEDTSNARIQGTLRQQ